MWGWGIHPIIWSCVSLPKVDILTSLLPTAAKHVTALWGWTRKSTRNQLGQRAGLRWPLYPLLSASFHQCLDKMEDFFGVYTKNLPWQLGQNPLNKIFCSMRFAVLRFSFKMLVVNGWLASPRRRGTWLLWKGFDHGVIWSRNNELVPGDVICAARSLTHSCALNPLSSWRVKSNRFEGTIF